MNIDEIQQQVFESFEIDPQLLPVVTNNEEKFQAFRKLLIARIEELAEKNMDKLMWLLYRVDVSERKLHATLKETPPENFAPVIADMIIERQIQKIKSRNEFGGKENDWNFDI
jgi:hypothetical protein